MSHDNSDRNPHPLYIPDLLSLICDSLDRNDWFSLMRTSRPIFCAIVSYVWREVEAPVLFDLIEEGPPDDNDIKVNFSRFDLYAPFVRQLRVYGRAARYIGAKTRTSCALRAQRGSLMPNLISLTLLTSDLYHDSDALFWLDLFLVPPLQKLHIDPLSRRYTGAWVSCPAISAILERIGTVCNTLQQLTVYPLDITRIDQADTSTNMFWPPCSQPDISPFAQLRRLSTGIGMLDKGGLSTLGRFPRLQYLSVDGCEEEPITLDLSLSEESFPSLKHLTLVDMNPTNAYQLLGQKRLAERLESLKVHRRVRYLNWEEARVTAIARLPIAISSFLAHTSRLKLFYFDISGRVTSIVNHDRNTSREFEDQLPIDFSIVLRTMSKLPLEKLTLIGLSFVWGSLVPDLASAFPHLNSLNMPQYHIYSSDLHRFAKIPKLRNLCLGDVRFKGLPEIREMSCSPIQKVQLKRFVGVERDVELPSVEEFAR
ncbi:hypothetical protein RhiJN_13316 [Ceratobasidium sp. AG-Ba]|nr:hypothetical protein RhiJN_13316 [Ceratobasidium sp. AG-Ba]QRW13874.1 hypothetical protein RhiLY_12873 [Ceratobasidium sp. AG-Ba]